MAGLPKPQQTTLTMEDMFHIELNDTSEPGSLTDIRESSKLKGKLKKVQKDLDEANKQVEYYKKVSEELKVDVDLEYEGRRMAKKKCYKLKEMSRSFIEIISDLASFTVAEGKKHRVGNEGSSLDNGDVEMLNGIPERLQSLIVMLEDAQSKYDFVEFEEALFEIMERFRLFKSKLTGKNSAVPSESESSLKIVEREDEGNDNEVVDHAILPIHSSTPVAPVAGHAAPKPTPRIDSGEADHVPFVGRVVKSVEPRMHASKEGSDSGLELSASISSPSSFGFGMDTPEQQFMYVGEDNQTDEAVRSRSSRRRHVSASTSNLEHGVCPGNPRQCFCGFSSRNFIRRHIWRVTVGRHSITGTHVCSICGDRFKSLQGLRFHLSRHLPKAEIINAMPAVIPNEAMEADYDEMPVLTQYSTSASTSSSLPGAIPQENPQSTTEVQSKVKRSAPHIAEIHYEVASSAGTAGFCCACGKRESTKGQLQTHIRSKGKYLKFKCPSCGKRFLFECRFRRHCKDAHKMMDPVSEPALKCPSCEESFSTYTDFFNHQYNMHVQSQ